MESEAKTYKGSRPRPSMILSVTPRWISPHTAPGVVVSWRLSQWSNGRARWSASCEVSGIASNCSRLHRAARHDWERFSTQVGSRKPGLLEKRERP